MLSSRAAESTGAGSLRRRRSPCPRSARPSTAPPAPPSRPRRRRASAPPSPRTFVAGGGRVDRHLDGVVGRSASLVHRCSRRIRPAAVFASESARVGGPDGAAGSSSAPLPTRADRPRGLDGGVDLFDRRGRERRRPRCVRRTHRVDRSARGRALVRRGVDLGGSSVVRACSSSSASAWRRINGVGVLRTVRRRRCPARSPRCCFLRLLMLVSSRSAGASPGGSQPRPALPRWVGRALDRR